MFLAKCTLNLPYIYPVFSSQKFLFSYIIFVRSGLTPWAVESQILVWDLNVSLQFAPLTIQVVKYIVELC